MKRTLLSIALLAVVGSQTGCASYLQAASSANTSAVVSARAAADLAAKVNAEAFCTMSVDTLDPCGIYFGTTGGAVYGSADGGESWTPIVRDLPGVLSVEVQAFA